MATASVSKYQGRGKVVYSGDYVDDSLELNRSFLQKWGTKNKEKLESEAETAETDNLETLTKLTIEKPVYKNKPPKEYSEPKIPGQSKKEQLQNELLIEQIQLARQKKEKNQGLMIPFDLVTQSSSQLFKNTVTQFRDILEKRLNRWTALFTTEQLTHERAETLKEINQAIENAINEGENNMQQIILASSNKKEVGEREI